MADTKISALTPATTPLAGTEVLPIVQSSTTKKVSVADLTVGRQVAANSLIVQGVATQTNGVAALYLDYTPGTSTTKIEAINPGFAYLPLRINAGTTYLQTNDVDRVTLAAGGNVTVNTGNLVIGTSGQGIDFSATPGTGTSELLADYEEGDWTPQYTNSTPPTTPYTMTITSATYTKIGRLVTVVAFIATSNVNTAGAAGTLRISGLPFTSAAHGVVSIGYAVNWAVNTPSAGYVESSATTIALQYRALANGATAALAPTDLTSGASAGQNSIMFTATYIV
jgi:hypothetical protein